MNEIPLRLALRAFGAKEIRVEESAQIHRLTSLSALVVYILGLLGFRFARIALAPLNHIALASEPAKS
jgi:hypothetical protein